MSRNNKNQAPEAKQQTEKFNTEASQEFDVKSSQNEYKGNRTAKENGSLGARSSKNVENETGMK